MSSNVLKLIPADPTFVPRDSCRQQAELHLRHAFQNPVRCEVKLYDHVTFVDNGPQLESIACPLCGTVLDVGWWTVAMGKAYEHRFADLSVQVPCCGGSTTLNDLSYRLPCGFSRVELQVWDPGLARGQVPVDQLVEELERILECRLRVFWAHY